jgi:hypothetical protein
MGHNDSGNSGPSLYSNENGGSEEDGQSAGDNRSTGGDWADAPDAGDAAAEQPSESGGGRQDEVDAEAAERHLNELLQDEELRRLIQGGDFEAFREDLHRRQRETDDPDRLAAIEFAITNPDEFAEPLNSAPTLWTLNGFGTKLYGRDQEDPATGLYLATQYFTMLWIPIFPIARYLVRAYGDEYQFFAKVDVGNFHSWWRRVVAFAMVAVIGAVAYNIATLKPDVRFVNGFDRPIDISVDGKKSIDVPPRSITVEALPAGEHTFEARFDTGNADGQRAGSNNDENLIETTSFDLPKYTELIAYNVAGMAPAYVRSVTYFSTTSASRNPGSSEQGPTVTPIAGQQWYINDNIHYFPGETPPEEIEMTEGTDKEVHWKFAYKGDGAPSAATMLRRHNPERLDDFLKQVITFEPTATWYHYDLKKHFTKLAEEDPKQLQSWFDRLKQRAWAHPVQRDLHSFYAQQARKFSQTVDHPDPLQTYREHHDSQDSAESALMLAHVTKDPSAAKSLLNSVVQQAPGDSELTYEAHRQLGTVHAQMNDCKAAMPHFEKGQPAGTRLSGNYLQSYATCAAAVGDTAKALNLIKKHTDYRSPSAIQLGITYGRIALTADGNDDPMMLLKTVGARMKDFNFSDDDYVLFATRMGLVLSEEKLQSMNLEKEGEAYAQLHRAVTNTPDQLVTAFADHPEELSRINFEIELLTALLAQVQADKSTRNKLEATLMTSPFLKPETLADETNDFAFDVAPPEDWNRGEKAAYYIAKSRVVSGEDAQRQALNTAKDQLRLHRPIKVVADAYLARLE